MKNLRSLFHALPLIFLFCVAPVFAEAEMNPTSDVAAIAVDGGTVTFAGKITAENIERFLAAVKGKNVSELIIASSGGEINAGMKMGEWVFDNGVDIVVERMCMSSCANYVFTAGHRKTINSNSIVAWHGSILQERGLSDEDVRKAVHDSYGKLPENNRNNIDLEALISRSIEQMRDYRRESAERQERFFGKIGVDEQICRVGTEKYGAEDFFALSVKDMERFGVRNVVAPEDYEKTDLAPFRRTGKSVVFITLE